jgi:hypothetical protein
MINICWTNCFIAEVNLLAVAQYQFLALCEGTASSTRFACDTGSICVHLVNFSDENHWVSTGQYYSIQGGSKVAAKT